MEWTVGFGRNQPGKRGFPTPGGPHKIMLGNVPAFMARRKTAPSPTKCCCPTYSSNDLGRIRSAKVLGRA